MSLDTAHVEAEGLDGAQRLVCFNQMVPAHVLDAISTTVDSQQAAMEETLKALVSLPTENPPGTTYLPCVELIEALLAREDIPYERIDIPSPASAPRAAVRAWLQAAPRRRGERGGSGAPFQPSGAQGPTLHFHGHYDVVPAASASQFQPRAEGDTLFGRGSSDMKSGLVAMLHAALAVRRARVPLRGCIELLFVPDEETGGEYGSGALVRMEQLARGSIGMLLPEPTSGVVWNANRGAITLDVTVNGRAAHVGLMRHGVNAVEQALPLLNRLFALKRDLDARQGSPLLIGGRVEAGDNFNLVPASCRFTIDRRIDPDEDFEVEKRRLFDVLDGARAEGVDLAARVIQEARSASTPTDGPLARALARSVEVVTGTPAVFEQCPGLLETRFYAERGVPALAYGPGILAVSHGPQEFVKISRMLECAKVYALTACDLLA